MDFYGGKKAEDIFEDSGEVTVVTDYYNSDLTVS